MEFHVLAWAPSGFELIVVAVIALLLFGKRLPEIARNMGKGIVEFKKGVKGIEDDDAPAASERPASEGREKSVSGTNPEGDPSER